MSCCNPRPALLQTSGKPDQSIKVYKAQESVVQGVDGKGYPINQPLVSEENFPRDNWQVDVKVKGIVHRINAEKPTHIFDEVVRLHALNEEAHDFASVWLNLNLQWLPRVAAKHRIVTVDALLEISTPA